MSEPLIDYTIQGSMDEDKVYNTKNQIMEEDITILAVPSYEVSTVGGGTTIIIGD